MAHRCMDCQNIVDGRAIDLTKGCPICGCKKFEYVRTKKPQKPKITVAEYVSQLASSEPQPKPEPEIKPEELGIDRVKTAGESSKAHHRSAAENVIDLNRRSAAENARVLEQHNEADTIEPEPAAAPKAPAKKGHNDRIESVRILEKGHYDINLPVLLNRKELVMSKEDGVYIVDLPSALKPPRKKKK